MMFQGDEQGVGPPEGLHLIASWLTKHPHIVEARYYERVGLPGIHTHSRGALL